MRDLAAVAKLLRDVRLAKRRFVRLAAVERAMIDPMLDRVARDLESVPHPPGWGDNGVDGVPGINPSPAADDEERG